jgi:hypothetical protein
MKQIVRLTESELKNIVETSVRRAIQEGAIDEGKVGDAARKVGNAVKSGLKTAAVAGGIGAATIGGNAALHSDDNDDYIRDKNAKRIETQLKQIPDTISKGDIATGKFESRIRGAVMESIKKLMNGRL